MSIFIDLEGASGASYRFRAWPDIGQPPMAGNFVVAETGQGGLTIHLLGVTNDLSRAEAHAREAGLDGKPLFVRLNVARATRHHEHEDILARHAPAKVFEGDV